MILPANLKKAVLAVVSEAFVTQLSIAARAQISSTDDVLATIQLFTRQYLDQHTHLDFVPSLTNSITFNRSLISGVYRVLGVSLDHALSEQPDLAIRNTYFQRGLGIQTALGFAGDIAPRLTEGMIAFVMLNLRYFCLVLAYACTKRPSESELRKPGQSKLSHSGGEEMLTAQPEMVAFLLPLAAWLLSLNNFIVDELCSMRNAFDDSGVTVNNVDANLVNQYRKSTVISCTGAAVVKTQQFEMCSHQHCYYSSAPRPDQC